MHVEMRRAFGRNLHEPAFDAEDPLDQSALGQRARSAIKDDVAFFHECDAVRKRGETDARRTQKPALI